VPSSMHQLGHRSARGRSPRQARVAQVVEPVVEASSAKSRGPDTLSEVVAPEVSALWRRKEQGFRGGTDDEEVRLYDRDKVRWDGDGPPPGGCLRGSREALTSNQLRDCLGDPDLAAHEVNSIAP
jgi:hypothetical protein